MYPNPMDVLPLPPRPDIAHYRKRAKELSRACRSRGEEAVDAWARDWVVDALTIAGTTPTQRHLDHLVPRVAAFAEERMRKSACALTQAQFLIARAHGFPSWPKFARHVDDLAIQSSAAAMFERAVDAIVRGDVDALHALLRERPDLVRARSMREHQGTLLHYVAANGVENYRQKTPPNIVDVAVTLLDAGADVNAEANMYGGGATTLGLAVTSAHPRQAGNQIALATLLMSRGARMHPAIIRDCLANGCPEAAVFLAEHGAYLDFEGAAGTGNVERVRGWLDRGLSLASSEANRGINMAVWYDRIAVISELLDRGLDQATMTRWDDERRTILHLAAWCGHAELVDLLIARGAPVNMPDERWHANALTWALDAWLVDGRGPDAAYIAIVTALVNAGAAVNRTYLSHERLRAFPDVLARLQSVRG